MHRVILCLGAVLLVGTLLQAQQQGGTPVPNAANDLRQKVGYMIGFNMGQQLSRDKIDVDTETLLKGIRDAVGGAKSPYTDEQVRQAFTEFRTIMANRGKQEGEAFLTKNKTAPGIVALPSGLQYKILKQGTGKTPKASDTVTTHYKGQLLDGTVFDSSVDRGQPASFPVTGVIKGWVEALQLMKVGDKWQLFIPSELGYGAQGTPDGTIPPHSVLTFEIELLSIAGQ